MNESQGKRKEYQEQRNDKLTDRRKYNEEISKQNQRI
jgi:hypothetical protein